MGWPAVALCWGPEPWTRRRSRVGLAVVAAHALGLAWSGWLASSLGVAGCLTAGWFIGLAAAWLIGWYGWVALRFGQVALSILLPRAALGRGWIFGFICLGPVVVNIIIGGLHVDMHQDPLWYHLSLPGQWAQTGRLEIFPGQMNSVMPLSSEALSTVILLMGGGVAVTSFYALATAWLCVAIPWLCANLMGRGGLWAGLIFSLMYASMCGIAPLPSKNDNLAALHMLGAAAVVWEVHLRLAGRQAEKTLSIGRMLAFATVAGFVVAGAVTSKLTSGPFMVPLVVAAGLVVAVYRGWQAGWVLGVAVLAGLVAVAPFVLRSVPLGFSPLHPVGAGWFPGNPALEPALRVSATHTGYPFSFSGLAAMLADLPEKIYVTLTSRDILMIWLTVAGLFGLLDWRRPPLVVSMACVAGFLAAFVWMKGYNNIGRYLVTAYPLAVPLVAWMGREGLRRMSSRRALAVGLLLMGLGVQTYVSKQWAWSRMSTIQWGFWPELSEERVTEAAHIREKGSFYLLLTDVRRHIPQDGRVMLTDLVYPFYLQRRAVWADEASQPLLPNWFRQRPDRDWHGMLKAEGITHVVTRWPWAYRSINSRLIQACGLVEIASNRTPVAPDTGWVLYRVPEKGPFHGGDTP